MLSATYLKTGRLSPTIAVNGVVNEKRHNINMGRHFQDDMNEGKVLSESRDQEVTSRGSTYSQCAERQCHEDMVLPNSMVDDTFYIYQDDSRDPFEPEINSINKAKHILMRLTCQEPALASNKKKKFKSYVSTDRASLTQLHLELKHKVMMNLEQKQKVTNHELKRVTEENMILHENMLSLRKDLKRVMSELQKVPKTRLHLELVEKVNGKLHDTIASRHLSLQEAAEENAQLREEVHTTRLNLKHCEHEKDDLLKEMRRRGDCAKELSATNCLVKTLQTELEDLKLSHKEAIKDTEKKHEDIVLKLQVQLRAMKLKYGLPAHDDNDATNTLNNTELKALVELKNESIDALRNQVMVSESTRRKLHNVIQELRGNIRVFVRVRPFLENEIQMNRMRQIVTPLTVLEAGNAITINGKTDVQTFEFDKVYGPTSTQDFVFEELSDFVQSALDGYSACIFAYGQTGSGKTHTMQGEGFGDMRGITPRAVEQILLAANRMKHTWNFYVQANFVEIYNEKFVDLLTDIKEEIEFFNSFDDELLTLNPGINRGGDKLTLRKDVLGQTFVEGLTNVMIDINDFNKGMSMINNILKCAARKRSVATTKMNDRSSRSHSVFTLDIAGKNIQSGAVTAGSLHLVDLAGSERLDSLDDVIDHKTLRETTNINKSLSCLGDVFSALASEASHIPYRNSKLTYLLQNCLGGDGKACMVVNLSPTVSSCNESMQSLRFAQRVSQIELGRGTKKVHFPKAE